MVFGVWLLAVFRAIAGLVSLIRDAISYELLVDRGGLLVAPGGASGFT